MKIFLEKYNKIFECNDKSDFEITFGTHLIAFLMKKKFKIQDCIMISKEKHEDVFDALLFIDDLNKIFEQDDYCISYGDGFRKHHTMILYSSDFIQKVDEETKKIKALKDYEYIVNDLMMKDMYIPEPVDIMKKKI